MKSSFSFRLTIDSYSFKNYSEIQVILLMNTSNNKSVT